MGGNVAVAVKTFLCGVAALLLGPRTVFWRPGQDSPARWNLAIHNGPRSTAGLGTRNQRAVCSLFCFFEISRRESEGALIGLSFESSPGGSPLSSNVMVSKHRADRF